MIYHDYATEFYKKQTKKKSKKMLTRQEHHAILKITYE